jgi:hypothetical protein
MFSSANLDMKVKHARVVWKYREISVSQCQRVPVDRL